MKSSIALKGVEAMDNIMTFQQIQNCPPETTLFLETKQTIRPAFFFGVIDRAALGNAEDRYAVHMMTAAKLAKRWEMRLYNRTWRLWRVKPTREERLGVKWE